MSQVETSVGGNPLRTISAELADEPYLLPNLASGRSVTIRREDSGTGGHTVTVTIPSGHYLDGILNGSKALPPDSETVFRATNPGVWESYGSGGGAGLTGTGGGAVTSTAQIAADAAFTGAFGPIVGSDAWLKLHAGGNLDAMVTGPVTRDSNGAATGFAVTWPDPAGTAGVYTATTVSTAFPGAVDAYTVTYGNPATKTVTQPAVSRDGTSGAVTNRPGMTVA